MMMMMMMTRSPHRKYFKIFIISQLGLLDFQSLSTVVLSTVVLFNTQMIKKLFMYHSFHPLNFKTRRPSSMDEPYFEIPISRSPHENAVSQSLVLRLARTRLFAV